MRGVILIDEVVKAKQQMRDVLVMAGFTSKEAEKLADLRVAYALDKGRFS